MRCGCESCWHCGHAAGVAEERARVVADLRAGAASLRTRLGVLPTHDLARAAMLDSAADRIEAGDHIPKEGGNV